MFTTWRLTSGMRGIDAGGIQGRKHQAATIEKTHKAATIGRGGFPTSAAFSATTGRGFVALWGATVGSDHGIWVPGGVPAPLACLSARSARDGLGSPSYGSRPDVHVLNELRPPIGLSRFAPVLRNTKCPVRMLAGGKALGRKHLCYTARLFSGKRLTVVTSLGIIRKVEASAFAVWPKECFSCPIKTHQRKPATRRAQLA